MKMVFNEKKKFKSSFKGGRVCKYR